MTIALVALTAGCNKDDQPVETKSSCEIGNTGKAVSSVFRSSYNDGSQIKIVDNATICPAGNAAGVRIIPFDQDTYMAALGKVDFYVGQREPEPEIKTGS